LCLWQGVRGVYLLFLDSVCVFPDTGRKVCLCV